MQPTEVRKLVGDVPNMTLEQGRKMTDFIHTHEVKDILELGFFSGVSTCYIAAALDERVGERLSRSIGLRRGIIPRTLSSY
jgi:predicted O-methyltransferase YrrM